MDYTDRKSILSLVEEATTTGEEKIQVHHVSQLKKLLRRGTDIVECAFEVILNQLRTEHAQVKLLVSTSQQVRLLSWQLFAYMFPRSKTVRELFEENLQDILRLSLGDKRHSLPLPRDFARLLQTQALENFREWRKAFPTMVRLQNAEQYISLHAVLLSPPRRPRDNQHLLSSSPSLSPSSPSPPTTVTPPRPTTLKFGEDSLLVDKKEIQNNIAEIEATVLSMVSWSPHYNSTPRKHAFPSCFLSLWRRRNSFPFQTNKTILRKRKRKESYSFQNRKTSFIPRPL